MRKVAEGLLPLSGEWHAGRQDEFELGPPNRQWVLRLDLLFDQANPHDSYQRRCSIVGRGPRGAASEGMVVMFGRVRGGSLGRSRWAAGGAVVAILVGAGGLVSASASGSPGDSSFVPITPCRLLDTRPADVVGSRSTPLGPQETYATPVWGTDGDCTIPAGATGLSMDVVAVNPTGSSYLTVFPADKPLPLASNLNWVAGQPATPNAVTVTVSADGRISFFNHAGTVDIAVDIVGYYEPSSSGPAGPTGPTGNTGLQGIQGPSGVTPAHVVWVATSGGNFTSVNAALASITTNGASNRYLVKVAPGTYIETAAVVLKDYVDIEGSGEDTTIITCACASSTTPFTDGSSATLRVSGAAVHSEVRLLTIANTGGNTYSTGIWISNATTLVSLLHVTVTATGGMFNDGVVNAVSPLVIRDSFITGATNSIARASSGPVLVFNTELSGATYLVGAGNCFNAFTTAFVPYTCA